MDSFYNPLERNAEYKFIPGGTHRFSITGESVDVPSLYVAKYAVTNERYNRFIDYLLQRPNKDTNPSLLSILPFSDFASLSKSTLGKPLSNIFIGVKP